MSIKIERLASTIEKEISIILSTEVKDEDIKFVTITGCEVTNDLSYAKVYFTVLDDSKQESTTKALEKAKSFIRGELSKRIEVRHTPELIFIFDSSNEYGKKIDDLIDKLHEKD